MIGSLRQFIELQGNSVFTSKRENNQSQKELSPVKSIRKKGKSSIESYAPQDKTDLLKRYEKNNIFNINHKKYKSIAQEVQSKDHLRRPLYEHRSFFVKPEVARDYIAKEELKRKHNLLRAILRMKQTEEEPKGSSDYEQSFQRLYSGFKQIHPEPLLNNNKQPQLREEEITIQKILSISPTRTSSGLSHRKRLQYQNCLSWAKKHQKNGDFFAGQLGKLQKRQNQHIPIATRSLIEDIGKKVSLSWLD